ncbi:meiotic recombination protein SPO11 [Tiliqua scincoides]|uniref:meiotic recombination protein SPO11 n=1 Tax=Tiliqua scincoides TaxID=71010 RepID=UPI00346346FF
MKLECTSFSTVKSARAQRGCSAQAARASPRRRREAAAGIISISSAQGLSGHGAGALSGARSPGAGAAGAAEEPTSGTRAWSPLGYCTPAIRGERRRPPLPPAPRPCAPCDRSRRLWERRGSRQAGSRGSFAARRRSWALPTPSPTCPAEQALRRSRPGYFIFKNSEVLNAVENIIEGVITSLSRNEAPVLILNNRSDWGNIRFEDSVGLQITSCCTTRKIRSDCPKSAPRFALFLKLLSIIYKMVQTNIYATKRDIFYTDTLCFGNQRVVDNIINDVSCLLKISRRSLHILSTSKGCIAGNLSYIDEDGTKVNYTCNSTATIPSNIEGMRNLITDAKFILIVEKDATFQRLLDDNFCSKMSPCIIITGKGVPDVNTRLLVRKLWDTCHVPIFTLMDADPHGIEIMCIYKYGSMSMSFEAHRLTVPAIRWLGLLPSDFERLNIPKNALIPLTKHDQRKLASLQMRPYIGCQPRWKKELEIMATSKMKAEIQALMSFSPDYLSRVYLPNKLQFGGWI